MTAHRQVRSGSMVVSALAYLLPFMTVSCPSGEETVTGLQLVTGFSVEQSEIGQPQSEQRQEGEPLAAVALGLAFAGAVVGMMGGVGGKVGCLVSALGSGILLLLLQSRISEEVQNEGMGMVEVSWEAGYWIAVAACIAAAFTALASPIRGDQPVPANSVSSAIPS